MKPTWQTDDGSVALFLGDCLEILPTLELESIDVVVTDPPYGHNNNNNDLIARRELALGISQDAQPARPIANDGPEANTLFRRSLPEWLRLLKPGCCCCCCCSGGGGPDPQFARWSLWMDKVFQFKQMVIWDKGPMGMGWHYRRSYETILVGEKPGAACHWCTDRHDIENIIRPGKQIQKILPSTGEHPTSKPVGLAKHFIYLHSTPGELVLDPFMGGGWAGIASIRTNRKFIGIEIDSKYFDMAVKRIKAELHKITFFPYKPCKRKVRLSLFGD